MILEEGETIHVIVRRAFADDLRRHFLGKVTETNGVLARVEGYVFVLDTTVSQYVKRPDKRIRIVGLADASNIITVLPAEANLEKAEYIRSQQKKLTLTDGETFTLEINEFGIAQ